MKLLLTALVVLVLAAGGAAGATARSGLRGTALVSPTHPVCTPGMSCSRPAAHALLRFWRNGRLVGHTRTDARGRFRITLAARMYTVTSGSHITVEPGQVKVPSHRYRSVTFKLDTGIR